VLATLGLGGAMKILIELLLCILHPLAVVLMWINLVSRTDLSTVGKLAWAIFGLIPLVPFLYVLTGGDLY
jgi:NADH:ubiquinone oxidoreductase subunit 3 (subunit A)